MGMGSSDPSNSPHLTNTTNMKVILILCVFAVCLPSIKAEDNTCDACCPRPTAPATTAAPAKTAAPTSTAAPTTKKSYLADASTQPPKCNDLDTEAKCNEKCGTATFTMSVAFVLVSVIMALNV